MRWTAGAVALTATLWATARGFFLGSNSRDHKAALAAAPAHGHASTEGQEAKLSEDGTNLFIFGYGSLLKEMSRIKTACKLSSISESTLNFLDTFAEVTPEARACIESVRSRKLMLVKAKGVRRGWYDRGRLQIDDLFAPETVPSGWAGQALDIAPTYLGATQDPSATCYGVLYRVSPEELKLTDAREQTYGTVKPRTLNSSDIEVLTTSSNETLPPGAQVRWYEMPKSIARQPTRQFPICQSYVDIVVGGALELEEKNDLPGFAMNVVATTHGWSPYWVNDRVVPWRPQVHEHRSGAIVHTLLEAAEKPGSSLKLSYLEKVVFPMGYGPAGRSGSGERAGGILCAVFLALTMMHLATAQRWAL